MSAVAAIVKVKGRRRAKHEVTERVAFVRELVKAHRDDRQNIHDGFIEFYGPTPARTIDEYIAKVRREWIQDSEATRPSVREKFLADLDRDLETYRKAKAWSAHLGARRLQARVLGLDVQTVDVRGGLTLTATPAAEPELTELDIELATEILEHERAKLAPPSPEETEAVAEVVQ